MPDNGDKSSREKRPGGTGKMPPPRALLMIPILLGLIYLLVILMKESLTPPKELPITKFYEHLDGNMVESIEIGDESAKVKLSSGAPGEQRYIISYQRETVSEVMKMIREHNSKNPSNKVSAPYKPRNPLLPFLGYVAVIVLVPLILYLLVFRSISRSGGAGGGCATVATEMPSCAPAWPELIDQPGVGLGASTAPRKSEARPS